MVSSLFCWCMKSQPVACPVLWQEKHLKLMKAQLRPQLLRLKNAVFDPLDHRPTFLGHVTNSCSLPNSSMCQSTSSCMFTFCFFGLGEGNIDFYPVDIPHCCPLVIKSGNGNLYEWWIFQHATFDSSTVIAHWFNPSIWQLQSLHGSGRTSGSNHKTCWAIGPCRSSPQSSHVLHLSATSILPKHVLT